MTLPRTSFRLSALANARWSELRVGPRSRQAGQSAMEYLVVCAALAFALGIGLSSEDSVLRMLLDAFAESYDKFAYAISLPS